MTRNPNKGIVAGVAAGLAESLGWPVWAVRGFYILAFFFFGLGFFLYVLAWAFTPGHNGQMNLGAGN